MTAVATEPSAAAPAATTLSAERAERPDRARARSSLTGVNRWIALGSALSELEVDFRAEALHGARIVARAQREDGYAPTFRHALVREGDGREIARLRSVWSAGAR